MRRARTAPLAAVLLALTTIVATGAPAFAATPCNDTYAGRTVVGGIPFTDSLDTTTATTDIDDTDINTNCGAPATDASVWYEVTTPTDTALVADVSSSDYSAGVIVATGGPTNWNVLTCGPGRVGWATTAGVKYSVIAIDDQFDGRGNGGTLNLNIDVAQPPPTIALTVNPTGLFNSKSGTATVSGKVTCSGPADFAYMEIDLAQKVGRFTIRGFNFMDLICDGTTRPWSLEVSGDSSKFSGGKALSVTSSFACGEFFCTSDYQEHIVQLKGGKR